MSLLTLDSRGTGPTFVWLHGFTQTRQSAQQFLSILAGRRRIVTLDLPGHGESSRVRANLPETARLIVAALGDEPFDLGGYSYGARVALHVALLVPDQVRHLVTIGVTRGIESVVEQRERRERDNDLATFIEEHGVEAFLDRWLAQPLFAHVTDRELTSRSRDGEALAASLRLSGTGTQEYLHDALAGLDVATLVMAGALDEKFSLEARAVAQLLPRGECVLIPHAGHSAHLDDPVNCARIVDEFLSASP